MSISVYRTDEGSETRTYTDQTSDGQPAWPVTSREVAYLVIGANSKSAAFDAVLADTPESESGLIRKSVRFDGFTGDGAMEFTAVYEQMEEDTTATGPALGGGNDTTVSFDCSGGTVNKKYAISQIGFGDPSKNPGRAINWNGATGTEIEIAGVDIPCGQIRETYTKSMRASSLTATYKKRINGCVGKVNAGKFMGYESGEVMFLGMSFSGRVSGGKVDVSFHFQVQPNENDAVVDDVKISNLEGFQYVWALPAVRTESDTPMTVRTDGVFVATVCEKIDFGIFGL